MIRLKDVEMEYPNGTRAIRGISAAIEDGEFVFLVGPSGSGKSTIIKMLTGEEVPTAGRIMINGFSVSNIAERQVPMMRRTLGVIFQDFRLIEKKTVYENLEFVMRAVGMPKKEIKQRITYVLQLVGLEKKAENFPSELSGGEQQRVAIARALVNNPATIIADEPTTALDVTIQAQILKLMDKLVKEQDASLILITHDLAVVSQMADRIIVMYCGKIVESGSRDDVIHRPSHPYTEGLLNSIPRMGEEQKRLESIPGMVPSMLDLPQGCYFAPRCKYCQDICRTVAPENHEVGPGHCAACHFPLTGGESHE